VHSYENPVIDVISLEDFPAGCGLGRIGKLDKPVTVQTLVNRIKKAINVRQVLVAQPVNKNPKASRNLMISTAACCAGSCGSLAQDAIKAGAQFYLTGEMRHHDALAATAAGMTVVCVGHSNSERLVLARLAQKLKGLLPKLQVSLSRQDKDPFVIG
jgi:putative NIF3 family GTP cyclohydrolase 1 type 2